VSDAVRAATDVVAKRLGKLNPRAAIVLGSGLAGVADAVRDAVRIPYKEIPGFPEPGAPGHKGELVGGTLEGVPVVVQSGRFHLYEGHAPEVAALPRACSPDSAPPRSWSPTRRAASVSLFARPH